MKVFRVIGAFLASAALAGCAGPGGACHPKPVALLSTAFPHSLMPVVPATMNGLAVDMLIDTGAQYSSVTPVIANRLNLPVEANKSVTFRGFGGSIFTSVAIVRHFDLGASRGTKILLPVLAMAKHKLPDGRRLAGTIGNDILRYYDLDMDLPAQQVFLVDTIGCGSIAPWRGALHPVSFSQAADGAPEVPITIDGHRLTAIIDTGSAGTIISPYLFRASGLAAEHPVLLATRHGTGIGDERFTVRFYRFHRLTIGGVVWRDPVIGVGGHLTEMGNRVVIGDNFTAHHELYVSNTMGQLFVR